MTTAAPHVVTPRAVAPGVVAARAPMVASVPPSPVPAVITLLGRPGCHLCDDAREVISRVAADLGVAWEERDITASERDLRDYSDMIPVTLINGVQHDFWHVSEQRLRAALAAAGPAAPA